MSDVSSQVAAVHHELIAAVSQALRDPAALPLARASTAHYREKGWNALCAALSARLDGLPVVNPEGLDDEDLTLLAAVDKAAADPAWLAEAEKQAETEAAEQMAALILAGTWGERDALAALTEMREAADSAGLTGSTAHAFIAMVEGERQLERLQADCPNSQAGLLAATLDVLSHQEAR